MSSLTLKSSIRDLELAVRDYSCLSKAGYNSIGDLVNSSYDKLLMIKNIKPDRLTLILDKVCSEGFKIQGYRFVSSVEPISNKPKDVLDSLPEELSIARVKEHDYNYFVNVKSKKQQGEIIIPCGIGNTDFGFKINGITEAERCKHSMANIFALIYNYLIRNTTMSAKDCPNYIKTNREAFSVDFKRVYRISIIILQLIKNNVIVGNNINISYNGDFREVETAVGMINSYIVLFSKLTKVPYKQLNLSYETSNIHLSLDEEAQICIEDLTDYIVEREIWYGTRINYNLDFDALEPLETILSEISPYKSFKEGQFRAICDMLNTDGHSICIMPTGSGKSLIFYFASLLQPLPIFIISPTDILIDDQIRNLWQTHHMDSVSHLKLTKENDFSDFLISANLNYLTPATFQNRNLLVAFRYINNGKQAKHGFDKRYADGPLLSYIVLDEIHCISNWGHDFRPEYLMLSKFLKGFLDRTTFLGFSATANYTIVSDIQKQLNIEQGNIFSPIPFDKFDISYNFIELSSPREMMDKAKEIIDELVKMNQRSIIFTKNDDYSILLADAIGDEAALFVSDYPVGYQSFADGKCKVLIASEELGIGINLPNVRNIIHFGMPVSKSEYVQEIGRAGRANEKVTSFVLYLKPEGNAPFDLFKRTTGANDSSVYAFEKKNDYYDCYIKFNNGIMSKRELSQRMDKVFNDLYSTKKPLYVKTYKEKSSDWFSDVETQKQYIYMLWMMGYVYDWYSYSGNDVESTVDIMIVVSSTNHEFFCKDSNMITRMKSSAIQQYEFLNNNRAQIMATQNARSFKEIIDIYVDWYYNRYLYLHKEMFLDCMDFVMLNKDKSDEKISDAIREYFSLPFAEIKNTESFYLTLSIDDIIKKISEGIGKSTLINIERINSNSYAIQLDVFLLLGNAIIDKFFDYSRFERIIRQISSREKKDLITAICNMYAKCEKESRFDIIRSFDSFSPDVGEPMSLLISRCYKEQPRDEIFYGYYAALLNCKYFNTGGQL